MCRRLLLLLLLLETKKIKVDYGALSKLLAEVLSRSCSPISAVYLSLEHHVMCSVARGYRGVFRLAKRFKKVTFSTLKQLS